MSNKSRFIRGILIILAFLGVLSVGFLIGEEHGYRRHLRDAMDSLRSSQHYIHEAMRDRGGRHLSIAMDHVERAMREVQEELR